MPASPPLFAWPSTQGQNAPYDPTLQAPLWADLGDTGPYSEFERMIGTQGAAFTSSSGIIDGGANGTGTWTYDNATVQGFGPNTTLLATSASGSWNRLITMLSGPVRSACFAFTVSISIPPTGDATIANIKDLSGNSPNTVRAGIRCTTGGLLRIDDGQTSQYVSTTPIVGGAAFTVIWYVQAQAGQQVWLYDQYGNLVEYSGSVGFTSNQFDTLNFGAITAWGPAVLVMRWGAVGYCGTQIPFSLLGTTRTPPPAAAPWPYLPTPGSPLADPFLPWNPWYAPDQAVAAQSFFTQSLAILTNPVESARAAVAASSPRTQPTVGAVAEQVGVRSLATQAPTRQVSATAVAATRAVVQAPVRKIVAAVTAARAVATSLLARAAAAVATLLPVSTGVGFALAQQTKWNGVSGTPTSSALTTTAGSLLVVTVGINSTTPLTSVTDTAGNTWLRADGNAAFSKDSEIWYCPDALALAGDTVTVNGPAVSITAVLSEWSGGTAAQPEQHSAAGFTSTTNPPAQNVTPTLAGDLVVSTMAFGTPGSTTATLSGAYTQLTSDQTVGGGQVAAYLINPAVGSPTAPTWTLSPGRSGDQTTVAFRTPQGLNILARARSSVTTLLSVATHTTVVGRVANAVSAARAVVEAPVRALRAAISTTLAISTPSPAQELSAASQDFEDGTVGAWGVGGTNPPTVANSTAQAHTGTHSLAVTLPTGTGGFGVSPATLPFNVPTVGAADVVGVWVYVPSGVSPVRANINGTAAFSIISTVNDAWQFLGLSGFVATASSHTLSVYPTSPTTAGQLFYIDTASVAPTLARRPIHAVTATSLVAQAPARALAAAVGARRAVADTLTASAAQLLTKYQTLLAQTTTLGRVARAVAATRTAVQAPVQTFGRALTATLRVGTAINNLLPPATATATSTAGIVATNGTYTVDASAPLDGASSFAGNADGSGDGLRLAAPLNAQMPTAGPKDVWYGQATVKNTSTASQLVRLYVEWFDASTVFISGLIVGQATLSPGQQTTFAGSVGPAPAGAAKAHLLVFAPASPTGYTQQVDDLVLQRPSQGVVAAVSAVRARTAAPGLARASAVAGLRAVAQTVTGRHSPTPGVVARAVSAVTARLSARAVAAVLRAVQSPRASAAASSTGNLVLAVVTHPVASVRNAATRAQATAALTAAAAGAGVRNAAVIGQATAVSVASAITQALRRLSALLVRQVSTRHVPFRPADLTATARDPLWTADANGDGTWTVSTRGGGVYHQNATSDQPIPVLVTPKFKGLDPTADPVFFELFDYGAESPDQTAVTKAATWYTDPDDGRFWVLCPCGPNSLYVPTRGTTKTLYVKVGDVTTLMLGPISVQFT